MNGPITVRHGQLLLTKTTITVKDGIFNWGSDVYQSAGAHEYHLT
ncbi:hypothetical protein [Morganella morganii IS15]|nr:hypothetical protein [Morganella morganii IS15]